MDADALVPRVVKTSEAMVLTMQDKWVPVFCLE